MPPKIKSQSKSSTKNDKPQPSTVEIIEKELTLDKNYSKNMKKILEELIKDRHIDSLRTINFEGFTSKSLTEQERNENIKIINKIDQILKLSEFDENKIKILTLKLINSNNENVKLIINLKDLYVLGFINKNNKYFSFKDNRIDEWKQKKDKYESLKSDWKTKEKEEKNMKKIIRNPNNLQVTKQELKENLLKIEKEKLQLIQNEYNKEDQKYQTQQLAEIKVNIKELEKKIRDDVDVTELLDFSKFNSCNKKIQKLNENITKNIIMIDENKKIDQAINKQIIQAKNTEKIELDYTGEYSKQGLNVVIKKEGKPDKGESICISQKYLNQAVKNLSETNNENIKNQEVKNDLVRIIFVTSEAMRFGSHKYERHVKFKNIPEKIQEVLNNNYIKDEWSKYIHQLRGGWTESSKENIQKRMKKIFKDLDFELKYWETIDNIFSDKNNINILNQKIKLQKRKNNHFVKKYSNKDLNLINEEEEKEFFKFYNCEKLLNSLMNLIEIECNKIKFDKQNIDKFKNNFKLRIMNQLLHSSLSFSLSGELKATINFKNESSFLDFKDIIVFPLILKGNIDLIKLLIYKGINVNSSTKCGNTYLIEASYCNNLTIVKLLLKNGADVNAKRDKSISALHFAVSQNNLEIVEELLNNENSKNKIDINIKDNFNRTPLHCVASNHGDIKILKELLNHPKTNVNIQDNDDNTALHNAIVMNNLEFVEELLNNEKVKNKIDINIQNNNGHTALHNATAYNNLNIVKLLLKNGADPNIKDYSGNTPLYSASGLFFLVEKQLKNNNLDDKEKQIPLIEQKHADYLNIIQELIDNGADPNIKNLQGETPLFIGIRSCEINIVKLLLKNGADPNIKNDENKKVIHTTNNDEIKKLLNNFSTFNKKIEILNSLLKEKDLDKEKISEYKNQLENEQKKLKELLNISDIEQIRDNDVIKKTDIDNNFFNQIFIIKVNEYAFDNIGIKYVLNAKNKLEPKYNIKKIGEILLKDLKTENNTEFFCESQTCLIEENLTKEKKEKLQVWKTKLLEKIHKKYQHFMKNNHKISETILKSALIALKQKDAKNSKYEPLKLLQEEIVSLKIEEINEEQAKIMWAIPKGSKIVSSQIESGCKNLSETKNRKDDEQVQDAVGDFFQSTNTFIQTTNKKFDVPGDGNCLFWAVANAYLLPARDNNDEFKQRFIKLFDKEDNLIDMQILYKNYDLEKGNDNQIYKNENSKKLITNVFRNRVVNYIENSRGRFEEDVKTEGHNFEEYLKNMRKENTWGGGIEIQAMSYVLDSQILVGDIKIRDDNENLQNLVKIFHVSADEGNVKNHYNFGLEKNNHNFDSSIRNTVNQQEQLLSTSVDKPSSPQI